MNIVKLATELAHNRVKDVISRDIEYYYSGVELYKDKNAEILEYTNEVQILFDEWYDYFLTKINKHIE